jgi:hypothetical protein
VRSVRGECVRDRFDLASLLTGDHCPPDDCHHQQCRRKLHVSRARQRRERESEYGLVGGIQRTYYG